MDTNEEKSPLDDTEPHPVIVLSRLDWRVSIAAVILGTLCGLGVIVWVVKAALDAVE
jgi:hypothetical protein